MKHDNKIGIIVDSDFASKHIPPYPHPSFSSYETPLRVKSIIDYFENINFFDKENVIKLEPLQIDDSIINLAHTKYHIDSIKHLSNVGTTILSEEVFITEDTFFLAKKAIGGTIKSIESVLNNEVNQSFALIRPPGHHALREKASGLCIFNNIANSILYLREKRNYDKKIAIVDIDCHFGDGLAQYFYEDPSILYFSVHEFDFLNGDIGFINELGEGEGLGKNINFPLPENCTDDDYLEFFEILEPILLEFKPDLIIIATGFDMHYDDPIGNGLLTSVSYFEFTKRILKIAEEINNGKLVFVLEGGYSLMALPLCALAIFKALLKESYQQPVMEKIKLTSVSQIEDIEKIKNALEKLLVHYWDSIK